MKAGNLNLTLCSQLQFLIFQSLGGGTWCLVPLHSSTTGTLTGGTAGSAALGHRQARTIAFLVLLLLLWLTVAPRVIISCTVLPCSPSFICSPSCTQVAFQIYCDFICVYICREIRYRSMAPSLTQSVSGAQTRDIHICFHCFAIFPALIKPDALFLSLLHFVL